MFMSKDVLSARRLLRAALLCVVGVSGLGSLVSSAYGQVPTVLFSSSTFLNDAPVAGTVNGSPYNGSTGHLAANSRGDLFYPDKPYSYSSTSGFLAELPYNGTTTVGILVNLGGGSGGVYIDPNSNIYMVDTNSYIDYVPFVNNAYATNTDASTLGNCALPLSSVTAPCRLPIDNSEVGFYYQPSDVQLDAAGNLYVYDQNSKRVLEALIPTGTATNYVLETVITPAANPSSTVSIAVDGPGNLYYTDGNAVTYYTASALATAYATSAAAAANSNPSGTAAGTSVGTGLSTPGGASVDSTGNLYIADTGNNRLVIIPLINGTHAAANQYSVSTGQITTAPAIDGYGDVYYAGGGANTLDVLSIGAVNFGIYGNFYNATTATPTLSFAKAGTLGSFTLTGPSSAAFSITSQTCTAGTAYAAGATCTVSLKFTTKQTGVPLAAINALDASGNVLGSANLYGITTTTGLNIDPGTVTAIGSAWAAPSAVAIGPNGAVLVADSTTGDIYSSTAGANQTLVATGFKAPSAILADSTGNLYVADTGNSELKKVPYVNGAYGTPTVIATGLSGPSGLAFSQTGTLFVADSGNARVLILASSAGGPIGTLLGTIGSGFEKPVGVAVDNLGSLYVADAGTNELVQVNLTTHTQTNILAGTKLSGVAAASDGSIYVIDSGAKSLTRIPQIGGILTPASKVVLSNPVTTPSGITTDLYNNLYLVDTTAANVVEDNRSAGLLNAGQIAVGSVSPTLTATVTNSGNSNPNSGAGGGASNSQLTFYGIYQPYGPFTEPTPSGSCPTTFSNAVLASGASCTLNFVFAPTSTGTTVEALDFSTSAPGTQTLTLIGNGPTITGPASVVYGTTPTYTLTITPDKTYTVSITGTAPSSVSVQVSGGSGTFTLPVLGVGSYTLSTTDGNGLVASESITVTAAVLTVTGSSPTRIFGEVNPALTYTITGFVDSQTAATATTGAPTVTTTAIPKSPAGTYAVTVGLGTLTAANYTFTLVNGTLTVDGGAPQVILFPGLANFTHATSVSLAALSTSGLPITYTVTGPATISGSTLTITGTGAVTVKAAQAGNTNFSAATSVSRTFTAQ